ncbi:hypothetical protein [Curtobacterium sp. MCSS17_016]|uniref:hypothetical protein n=1 Tax=Curtobacterium sp. MCSS17_016 TaxID=2175644 RepID=UPI000DA8893D|nr:hypothetical protein [Curtobacterium sp. MCSS17_016]WIE81016.1 hypothetical protein DEJ19_021100 [Curtobacterium sp. MCSS17_016]
MTDKRQARARDIGAAVAKGHSSTEFASRSFAEDTVAPLTLAGPPAWDATVTPTADQERRARVAAAQAQAFQPSLDITELARQKAIIIAEQEGAYNAWANGQEHPDDDQYEAIWSGLTPGGTSAVKAQERLDKALAKRAELDQPGADKKGAGYATSDLARKHLDEAIALYTEALRCGGRNLSVNQANVRQNNRVADNVPF